MISRTALIAFLLCVAPMTANGQPIERLACEAFAPSSSEISEVLSGDARIPKGARLYSACVVSTPTVIGGGQLVMSETREYQFLWPGKSSHRDVNLMQEGGCSRAASGSIKCYVAQDFVVERKGEKVMLSGVDSARELYELFAFGDRVFGEGYRILEVRQDYVVQQERFIVARRNYSIRGVSGMGEKLGYDVERRCNSVNECEWKLSGPTQWRY